VRGPLACLPRSFAPQHVYKSSSRGAFHFFFSLSSASSPPTATTPSTCHLPPRRIHALSLHIFPLSTPSRLVVVTMSPIAARHIKKTRRSGAASNFNRVVKWVNGSMITGIRLRSGYIVDDPPAPPSVDVLFDVDLVGDEEVVEVRAMAAAGATRTTATSAEAAGDDLGRARIVPAGTCIHVRRVKQTAVKSTGGCSRCSIQACCIHAPFA